MSFNLSLGAILRHTGYASHVGADTTSIGVLDTAGLARELSPGSEKKRSRPKSEGDMGDEQNDAREFKRPRLPHIEVEHKYRESLNHEFERLPAIVPNLPELGSGATWVAQKQTKAAGAIDYTRCLEGENDMGSMNDTVSIAPQWEAEGPTVTDNGNYDDTVDELLREWTTVYK